MVYTPFTDLHAPSHPPNYPLSLHSRSLPLLSFTIAFPSSRILFIRSYSLESQPDGDIRIDGLDTYYTIHGIIAFVPGECCEGIYFAFSSLFEGKKRRWK